MHKKRILWNNKFTDKKDYVFEPNPFIKQNFHYFKENDLLDIACGYGKNSVFLAENKFKITAVDISDKAIEIFRKQIITRKLKINIVQAEINDFLNSLTNEIFHNILICRFKPDLNIINRVCDILINNGIFMLVSFNIKHNKLYPRFSPLKCYLNEKEFIDSHQNLKILLYEEFQFNGGYYNGYIFQKIKA